MKQHRFLLYPAGAPGIGLLILRLSVAAFLLTHALVTFEPFSPEAVLLIGLACLIGLGVWTRTISIISATIAVWLGANCEMALMSGLAAHGLDAVVLAICGPGAFSFDARLFGRATVHLPGHA
jgi:putative oxidoreductase